MNAYCSLLGVRPSRGPIAPGPHKIATTYGRTPGELAIAWVLRNPAVSAAIVGARRPGQLKELIGAADWPLPADDVARIEQFLRENRE